MRRFDGFEDLLNSQCMSIPESAVLLFEERGSKAAMSWSELNNKVRTRAAGLKNSGAACLGVVCDGSIDCVAEIFAGVLAGLRIVLLDENAPDEFLIEQITETQVDLLWGDAEITDALGPFLPESSAETGAKTRAETGAETSAETGAAEEKHGISEPDNKPGYRLDYKPVQILFFTSGTTGRSKAVVLTDRSLMAAAYNGSCMLALTPEDILLCQLPLNHVFGFVCSLLWGLACGAPVALGRGMRHYADDPAFFRPTVLSAVPALLAFLLKNRAVNEELKLVLVGAGPCDKTILDAAAAADIRVSFGYGMTETSSGIAISTSGDPFALDICPEDKVEIAPDGEILVSSPACMMQGYFNRPEETDEVLKNGVLYTGDLGYLDENGRLHLTGRKKEMLVLPDGTKIFLPEYEAALQTALGGIMEEADLAVADAGSGPVLLIFEDPAKQDDIWYAIAPVLESYPRDQKIRRILFTDKPLPRTATGKLRRDMLKQMIKN